jgi:hypothetical protein
VAHFTVERRQIETGSEDEDGILVMADGRLVAVLVKLEADVHDHLRGRWFIEARFGNWNASSYPFSGVRDAVLWIARNMGEDQPELAEIIA